MRLDALGLLLSGLAGQTVPLNKVFPFADFLSLAIMLFCGQLCGDKWQNVSNTTDVRVGA